MNRFALNGISIRIARTIRDISHPVYEGSNYQVNQHEYKITVDGVGCFHVCRGKRVEFIPDPFADAELINLFLNSHVLAAILHQRKIINFHASSFVNNDLGIMLLGDTGAGKSSVTASFLKHGAEFVSDDQTPVIFIKSEPFLIPFGRNLRLKSDSAIQLNIEMSELSVTEKRTGKSILETYKTIEKKHRLNALLFIEIGNVRSVHFNKTSVSESFELLRSQICSWEMLAGMPETEADYLRQLILILEKISFIRIKRPENISILSFHHAIADYLNII